MLIHPSLDFYLGFQVNVKLGQNWGIQKWSIGLKWVNGVEQIFPQDLWKHLG